MAVIISNGDTTLNTANGFYRVEAYNVGILGGTLVSSADFNIPVTFANAGNCQGLGLAMYKPNSGSLTFTVTLQENVASVWTDRTAVTYTEAQAVGSNPYSGTPTMFSIIPFIFSSPYAVDTTASKWRFRVQSSSATFFHTSSGSNYFYFTWCDNAVSHASGDVVISKDKVTIDKTTTATGVLGTGDTANSIAMIGCRIADHTANKYSFDWDSSAAYTLTVSGYILLSSDSGFSAGTSGSPVSLANKGKIVFQYTPTAGTAGRSGFWSASQFSTSYPSYYGQRTNLAFYGEVPTTPNETLAYNVALDGTATMTIASPCVVTYSSHRLEDGDPVYFSTTGALPTGITAGTIYYVKYINSSTFNLEATRGGGLINTSGSQSGTHTIKGVVETVGATGWSVGDNVWVGKRMIWGTGDVTYRTISSVSGTQIKLSSSLTSYMARKGGVVYTNNGYGFEITTDSTASVDLRGFIGFPSELIFSGVMFSQIRFDTPQSASTAYLSTDALRSEYLVSNCFVILTPAGSQYFFTYVTVPPEGVEISNTNFVGGSGGYSYNSASISTTAPKTSGVVEVKNCNFYSTTNSMFYTALTSIITYKIHDNIFQNFRAAMITGLNTEFYDNVGYGTSGEGYQVQNLIEPVNVSGNSLDRHTVGVRVDGNIFNATIGGFTFGPEAYTSGADFTLLLSAGYTDLTITSCTNLQRIVQSSRFTYPYDSKVTFEDLAAANDSIQYHTNATIQKTGTGLTDTTAHTAGGYAMRIEPIQYLTLVPYSFRQNIPTGNIQNKQMSVMVWVKLNSANYYAGTNYQMPRLKITYDQTSTTYAEAAQSTDWQLLHVPITPLTTYGQITAEITAYTDATSTNAYFYVDDYSVLYPAGTTINLGSLDNWYRGTPIIPTIATLNSANDVWAVQTSTMTTAGSIGKFLVKLIKFIRNLVA
jgi:hypothetical protein